MDDSRFSGATTADGLVTQVGDPGLDILQILDRRSWPREKHLSTGMYYTYFQNVKLGFFND